MDHILLRIVALVVVSCCLGFVLGWTLGYIFFRSKK